MDLPEHYLELSEEPLRFEAGNQVTNVFFDDSNKQVFAVRSGGVMGVVVKGKNDEGKETLINFRMEDRGPVLSIKFSPDQKVLAVHRTSSSIEFMNFNGTTVETEYTQSCKKNNKVLGFVWSLENEIAFITDHGVELFKVIAEKRTLKPLKSISLTVQWFVWCSLHKIALLAATHGSQLQPVLFKQGTVGKLPKVECEPGKMALERDVTLGTLYGVPAVLILRHQSGPQTAEVHVHTLSGQGLTPIKSHVLKLGLSGRFAINIVDDLILVHHQASRSSQVFDISLSGESDGMVRYHKIFTPPKSFKPALLNVPGISEPETHICELYSPNWVVFQPNIVIDAKLGCLWHINLLLLPFCTLIPDLAVCTQVALKRTDGKPVLLKLLLDNIKLSKPPLDKIQESFDHINKIYKECLEAEVQTQTASPVSTPVPEKCKTPRVLIDQTDIYNEILLKLDAEIEIHKLEWILICYITSLSECNIPPHHNINQLLLTTLVRRKKFTALQQLLQYGVIADSKPLACSILSLGNVYKGASQLALDMLFRLGAKDEIEQILLSQGEILTALKMAGESANPRKFLQAAKDSGDDMTFHSVLYYFENSSHFSGAFKKDDRLDNFVHHYNSQFMEK